MEEDVLLAMIEGDVHLGSNLKSMLEHYVKEVKILRHENEALREQLESK